MWGYFVVAFAAAVVLLFAPGVIVARAARFAPLQCLGYAPVISVAGYAVLCLVYGKLGLPTNVVTVVGGMLVFALAVFAAAWVFRRAAPSRTSQDGLFARVAEWLPMAGLYLVVPLAACTLLFLKPMDGADAFMQAFDNISHMGTIRGALNSGLMDPLGAVGYYTGLDDSLRPFTSGSSFYPEMWHMIASMIVPVAGGSVPVAINALNVAFSFVVAPFGVAALFIELFGADRRKVLLGVLACIAFESFPWGMLVYGPLYPNLASFTLVPAMVAQFLLVLREGKVGASRRVVAAVFFVAGALSCAVIQPSAVFTVGVLVAPFCVWKASRVPLYFPWARRGLLAWRIAFAAVAAALICGVWVFMYDLPALYPIVHNHWASISTAKRTLFDIAFLGLMTHPLQPLVVLFVYAGIVRTIRERKWLWLSFSYVLCCIMYFACAATDGFWDSFLTGFWYSDQYRIAGMVGLAGMPLFALGFDWLLATAARFMGKRGLSTAIKTWFPRVIVIVVAASIFFCPVLTVKRYDVAGAFSAFSHRVSSLYNPYSFRHLSHEEVQFSQEAMKIVGDEGLVANQPFDGSVYLFGSADAPVYYKSLRSFGSEREKTESVLIREHLSEIANNEAVQQAVRAVGIKYVLVLDQGDSEKRPHPHGGFKEEQWVGISSITDETPGFTPVLSEGDMRLYKIDPAYTASAQEAKA